MTFFSHESWVVAEGRTLQIYNDLLWITAAVFVTDSEVGSLTADARWGLERLLQNSSAASRVMLIMLYYVDPGYFTDGFNSVEAPLWKM